jgi:O-antigen ligase
MDRLLHGIEKLRLPAWTAALAVLSASFSVSYTQSFLGLSLLLGLLTRLRRPIALPRVPLPFQAAGALFAWLILDWIITALGSQNTLRGLLRGEAADLFLCLFGLHVFWLLEQDRENRRILFYGFIGFGIVMTVFGTASLFTEHRLARLIYGRGFLAESETRPQHLFGILGGVPVYRPIGLLNNRLTYAGLLVLLLPVMIHAAVFESRRLRILAACLAAAAVPLLFVNGTRSALAGLAAAGVWAVIYSIPRRLRVPAAIAMILLALGGILLAASFLRQTDFQRPILWTAAFDIFSSSPVTGAGPGQFETAFLAWKTVAAEKFPLAWYYLESTPRGHAHNDLLHLLAVGGAPAGILFLGLCAFSLGGPANGARWILPALAGFFIAGLAQCYFQDDETVILFWVVLGLAEHLRRQEPH